MCEIEEFPQALLAARLFSDRKLVGFEVVVAAVTDPVNVDVGLRQAELLLETFDLAGQSDIGGEQRVDFVARVILPGGHVQDRRTDQFGIRRGFRNFFGNGAERAVLLGRSAVRLGHRDVAAVDEFQPRPAGVSHPAERMQPFGRDGGALFRRVEEPDSGVIRSFDQEHRRLVLAGDSPPRHIE